MKKVAILISGTVHSISFDCLIIKLPTKIKQAPDTQGVINLNNGYKTIATRNITAITNDENPVLAPWATPVDDST